MITKLTPEQEVRMSTMVEEYIRIGICTDRINKEAAKKYSKMLYEFLGQKLEATVIADGPVVACSAAYMLEFCNQLFEGGLKNLPEIKETQEVRLPKVWAQVEKTMKARIKSVLPEGDISEIFETLKKAASTFIDGGITFIYPYLDGQFFVSYVAWFKYMQEIGVVIPAEVRLDVIADQTQFGLIYPLDQYCIISERLCDIHMKNNTLHHDGGPAVIYRDGTQLWSLNGVRVPQWLAETPHNKIECGEFAKLNNAEVRREFVRKVGIERICKELSTNILDKVGEYELHSIDLGGGTGVWPYLRMRNPSIDAFHMECVDKGCKTVSQALAWRNQTEEIPEVLT